MDNVLVHSLCLALVLSTSCLISCGAYELKASQWFQYRTDLDETYKLSWDFNKTHIMFQFRVNTTGYIKFGISRDKITDGLIAWVDDKGNVHISDAHNAMDQSWILLEGSEKNGRTTITVLRRLDTGAKDYISIPDGTATIQFGYNKYDLRLDASNLNDVHTKMSQKYILLLNPVTSHRSVIVDQQFKIPAGAVTSKCSLDQATFIREKHHITKFEPFIEQGKEKFIRNMVVYACSSSQPLARENNQMFDCAGSQEEQQCFDPILLWGSGGTTFELPDHAGLPVASSSQRFMLLVSYTNEGSTQDVTVRAGFRAQMTNRLRKYDAGFFMVGRMHDKTLMIPPHQKQFVLQGACHSDCLKQGMNGSIQVIADILHAHSMARELATRHFRGSLELEPIQKDKYFTNKYQEIRMLKQERTVKPEDTLVTQCSYDSQTRSNVTTGGMHSRNSMCMSFLMYYPKRDLVLCASSLDMPPNMAGVDWTNKNESDMAILQLDQWNHTTQCIGTKTQVFGKTFKLQKGHLTL